MDFANSFLTAALGVSCLAIAACGDSGSADSPSSSSSAAAESSVVKAAASPASLNGATIPSATRIIDGSGNIWSVSVGVIYANGALAGYSNEVTLLLYDNNIIYQQNSAGGWWSWSGSNWVSSGDPPPVDGVCGTTSGMTVKTTPAANLCSAGTASTVGGTGPWAWSCGGSNGGKTASCSANIAPPSVVSSPSGTSIPPATQIIDGSANAWTVSGGVIYEKGALAGYSNEVTMLLYDNNIIYQENSAGGWWAWNGSTWVSSNSPVSGATTPTIAGSPPTEDLAGEAYSFVPTVTNPGGGILGFSIAYMPAWASFNKATGAITGTPTSVQVGTYPNILINVSDGSETASLAPFSITVTTGSASLSWTAPTQDTNGTPLTDLAGYTIYYGTSPSALIQTIQLANPSSSGYVVSNLSAGTYYFAVAAYTAAGTQSARSATDSKTLL